MKASTRQLGIAAIILMGLSGTAAATPGNGDGNGNGNGNGHRNSNGHAINPMIMVPQIMQSFPSHRGHGHLAPVFSHQLPSNAMTKGGVGNFGHSGEMGKSTGHGKMDVGDKGNGGNNADGDKKSETKNRIAANTADESSPQRDESRVLPSCR